MSTPAPRPLFLLFSLAALCGVTLLAQQPPPGPDMTVDAATRAAVIDGALGALNEAYVFPEVAAKIEQSIRARQKRHEYTRSPAPGRLPSCSRRISRRSAATSIFA